MAVFELMKSRWESMPKRARLGLATGIAAVFLLLAGGSYWLLRDDYQVLFSDLNPQDASAMVSELERMKVPYKLSDNGATILVEQELVYKTRMKLMGKGLDLHGAVGMEIFNNSDFGMTDFAQKVNYQRALQGELARTIMGFEEIKQARVHLVLPESGLFKHPDAKPKASISLVMRNGAQLRPEQISGIQRLVAASVPEIAASAVTILDQHGVAVSKANTGDDSGSVASSRLETKRQIEDYLTRKVLGVLDRAVGPGRAIVSVDAVLNFDQMRVTQESVVPLPNVTGQNVGAVVRRRDSSHGGDPVSDALAATAAGGRGTPAGAMSLSSEVEFANGKRVEQIVSEPGGIRRLTIGVMIPGIADPVELAKLKEVVTMAAGIQAGRGDAIVVYNQATATPNLESDGETRGDMDSLGKSNQFSPREKTSWSTTQSYLAFVLMAISALALATWGVMQRQKAKKVPLLKQEQRELLLAELRQWAAGEHV